MSQTVTLDPPAKYVYLHVHISGFTDVPENINIHDELSLRKAIQDALAKTFGVSAAATYIDVLRLHYGPVADFELGVPREEGDVVIRVVHTDAPQLKTALAIAQFQGPLHFAVVGESDFLPALLASSLLSE
ncbi:hypothetical protein EW145_g5537 [Phellinidium pouzarii]|uniref:Uncharacterized protein n=1 Tax=Phellinidium pouzarii TaxID=167371 RepID=A0A4S4KZM1_9AGAM|nr:hypothetical protein EW145_g5537 [Phellinidium pouzarii]